MASAHTQNLAAASVNAAQGNWFSAAANVAKSLIGGSGKTPSVLQGFRVEGQFDGSGFRGDVWGFDQKGNRWIGTGETSYLRGLGLDLLGPRGTNAPLSDDEIRNFAGSGISVPVSVQIAGADNTVIPDQTGAAIADQLRGLFVNENKPPFTPTGAAAPGQPGQLGQSSASPATVIVTGGDYSKLVPILLIAAVAFFVLRKGA